ncbi:MAG: hypothetical protein MRECE_17c045, partial [Mycoplasmataceae bacterium CE_OT135]
NRIKYLDISNRDLTGKADLSEFTALTSLNSYNNKIDTHKKNKEKSSQGKLFKKREWCV